MMDLIDKYNTWFDNDSNPMTIKSLYEDFTFQVCKAIEDELYDLKRLVSDVDCSQYEILAKIDELIEKIN